jgi:hypothetical protein
MRVKCTVMGLSGVEMDAIIAWVSGSNAVFEEGTITPNLMGPAILLDPGMSPLNRK